MAHSMSNSYDVMSSACGVYVGFYSQLKFFDSDKPLEVMASVFLPVLMGIIANYYRESIGNAGLPVRLRKSARIRLFPCIGVLSGQVVASALAGATAVSQHYFPVNQS